LINRKWSPVGDRLKTKWASKVDPEKVWPEYPRPQLVRNNWVNLNGLWEYSITDLDVGEIDRYEGQILVPFAVESSLSGVQRRVDENHALWYRRRFKAEIGSNELLILNFDSVDYHTLVFLNEHFVGEHKGGYDRFSFDVTKFFNANQENTLVLKVIDFTSGAQPLGKQRLYPGGKSTFERLLL
jgi:beta-galactosidase/beta-glucuronidase